MSAVLNNFQEIVECVTAVLEDVNVGQEMPDELSNEYVDTVNTLVERVQTFTTQINGLNESYTRIHLFFVIFHKVNGIL